MEKKAILFINWTDEDFTWKWDGMVYEFKAKQEIYLPDFQARHFAKHLTDRELLKRDLHIMDSTRKEFELRCFGDETVVQTDEERDITVMNKNKKPKKKVASKKKAKKPVKKPKKKVEESFDGLKEKTNEADKNKGKKSKKKK